MPIECPEQVGQCIVLRGAVQGIGLRPAVARWASDCGINGTVTNGQRGVTISIEGSAKQLQRFGDGLLTRLPQAARVENVERYSVPVTGCDGFRLDAQSPANTLATRVPPDSAVCKTCLAEVADSKNRRINYALNGCAECGPRYSIIESMPYQRRQTAMERFTRCSDCRREYSRQDDRRFHAQTICCLRCGPNVWCTDRDGRLIAQQDEAVDVAARALRVGDIIALRGIGGYQLLVDATQQNAVQRLRRRKHRTAKPFAIMVQSMADAARLGQFNEAQRKTLTAADNPIVVVDQRAENELAAAVCLSMNTIGVMLPTTPLHWQLFERLDTPLVVTSGNIEGRPIEYVATDAQSRLASVADLWIHHDRDIVRPLDDSVVRVIGHSPVTLRLGRGLAPWSLNLDVLRAGASVEPEPILALGGQMKAAVAVFNGQQAVLGPHVGELDEVASRDRWIAHVADLGDLYGVNPRQMVHDLHPGYFTSCWADEQPAKSLAVQHHHAHVAAAMIEHGWLDRAVLGVAFDGTGYGTDATVWGGELLHATAREFTRVGHLRPFRLAGGEAAIRQPWRVAVALVRDALGRSRASCLQFDQVSSTTVMNLTTLLDHDRFSVCTTSVGRLFDGIAALILGITSTEFEGQPSMLLEAACDRSAEGQYTLPLGDGPCAEIDWRPLVRAVCEDRHQGVVPAVIATRFHRAVADVIVATGRRWAPLPVVLAGGVFHNCLLTEMIAARWPTSSGPLGLPGRIPPGDGGLAAGQLAVAMAQHFQQGNA